MICIYKIGIYWRISWSADTCPITHCNGKLFWSSMSQYSNGGNEPKNQKNQTQLHQSLCHCATNPVFKYRTVINLRVVVCVCTNQKKATLKTEWFQKDKKKKKVSLEQKKAQDQIKRNYFGL